MDELPPLAPLEVARHLPFLRAALHEDGAGHDLTVEALVPAAARATADIVAKEPGVAAGLALAAPCFRLLDPEAQVVQHAHDGEDLASGECLVTITGRARAILSAERTVLNLLRHLCGVATHTRAYVEALMATGARLYDTRKTTPGLRELEKYAVRCGGGNNHRMGLSDACMVKENHLYAAFGRTGPQALIEAIGRCHASAPAGTPLYVEVETLAELEAVLTQRVDVVMLDGFDLGDVRRALKLVRALPPPRPLVEATGGVTLATVGAYAAAGVQRISVGAVTHSAPALDLSLRVRGAAAAATT